MRILRRLAEGWNDFFFTPVSPLPLALYRIVFGLILLADAALLAPDLSALFGDHGVLSLEGAAIVTQGLRVDLIRWLPAGDGWLRLFFALYVAAVVLVTIGFGTRAATIVVWLGLVSLHHRNGLILNSADNMLRIAAFWMMFAPAGAALSVDAWRRGRAERVVPWAQRMIQLQVAIVYLTTASLKLTGPEWQDGTALYYVTRLPEFARFPVPYLFDHLWTIRLLSWGTVAIELSLAVLVWLRPLRRFVLAAGVALHLGIEWAMALPLMEWVMIGAYVLFLDDRELSRIVGWVSERLPAAVVRRG